MTRYSKAKTARTRPHAVACRIGPSRSWLKGDLARGLILRHHWERAAGVLGGAQILEWSGSYEAFTGGKKPEGHP